MGDEEPSDTRRLPLDEMLLNIKVQKYPEPILSPNMFSRKFTSIRNPAAFIYGERIGLLCTVRHANDNKSRLHLAWSYNGKNFTLNETPFIDTDLNSVFGVEDARVTQIGNKYLISFTAYKGLENGVNTTRISVVETKDFTEYYGRKIILDDKKNNKNGLIFQNGEDCWIIDRPFNGGPCVETPSAQIARLDGLDYPQKFKTFLKPRENQWDNARVGINTPPLKLKFKSGKEALFMLYHGVGAEENIYRMGYILADLKNPENILNRSESPLIEPTLDWEIGKGKYGAEVPNVIFGQGLIQTGKQTARFYYAGADKHTGFADITIENATIQK